MTQSLYLFRRLNVYVDLGSYVCANVREGVSMNGRMGINVCECLTVYLEGCIYVSV